LEVVLEVELGCGVDSLTPFILLNSIRSHRGRVSCTVENLLATNYLVVVVSPKKPNSHAEMNKVQAVREVYTPLSISSTRRPLEGRQHVLHFNITTLAIRFGVPNCRYFLRGRPSWISLFVFILESQVSRRTWAKQNNEDVLQRIAVIEWSIAVLSRELLRVQILACGLRTAHQEDMIAPETDWIRSGNDAIDEHCKRYAAVIDCVDKIRVKVGHVAEDLAQAREREKEAKHWGSRDKGEKVTVVAPTNAVVKPHTVVVLRFHAVVADPAVVRSWIAPNIAGLAVLCGIVHGWR
jgi:hypothetical protein